MKLKLLLVALMACALATSGIAGQNDKMTHHGHVMVKRHPGPKMRSLGHGVFIDSRGHYHSADGKFMSKAQVDARLHPKHMVRRPMPRRDSHGRFIKAKPMHNKPGMLARMKDRLHMGKRKDKK